MKIFGRRQQRPIRLEDDEPIPLTQEGLKRLKEKLARLKESLPGIIDETQRTAAYGDRSDNAEYKDAKSTLRRTQSHILHIEDQLRRVSIIKMGQTTSGKIALGSTVTLESEKGTRSIFQIVGSHETNPTKGRISHLSPFGKALIGHLKNDMVTIKTPAGETLYRVVEVK